MTVPAGQNSAHIQQLEAGRLYDIILVAEKGTSTSAPAATQVTPGEYAEVFRDFSWMCADSGQIKTALGK